MCGILALSDPGTTICGSSSPTITVTWDNQEYAPPLIDISLFIDGKNVKSCTNCSSLTYTPSPCDFGPGTHPVTAFGDGFQVNRGWVVESVIPKVSLRWDSIETLSSGLFSPKLIAAAYDITDCKVTIDVYLDEGLLISSVGPSVTATIPYQLFDSNSLASGPHTIRAVAKSECGDSEAVYCKFVIGDTAMNVSGCSSIHLVPILFIESDGLCALVAKYQCDICWLCSSDIMIPVTSSTDLSIQVEWAEISSPVSRSDHIDYDYSLGSGTVNGIFAYVVPSSGIYSIIASSSTNCTGVRNIGGGYDENGNPKKGIILPAYISGNPSCTATLKNL
ncbi:hypothetical protein [uncultured Methanospirillum sp.]|uniref:hypothetical protein n=1 Tax=uncultured Methanospirillum sp. TaxID=262503 RepID=UPI0029C71B44|nr:hypothetical protein [uncultured Methanospirillum sp.]